MSEKRQEKRGDNFKVKKVYKTANAKNPNMGLDNKTCQDPVYWCRNHQVWLSEEDAARKCKKCLSYDMMNIKQCDNLEKKSYKLWLQKLNRE